MNKGFTGHLTIQDNGLGNDQTVVWQLDKYARYIVGKNSSTGQWSQFHRSSSTLLVMTLTDTKHLVIVHGSTVLESHSLSTARAWMRGLCKNDSLLFLYKHGKGTRRFKVRFLADCNMDEKQICSKAAITLSNLFSIHLATPPPIESSRRLSTIGDHTKGSEKADPDVTKTSGNHVVRLMGDIPLGKMAQQLIQSQTQRQLPDAYKEVFHSVNLTNGADTKALIGSNLRLFLTDPSFPSFVELVDLQLKSIMEELVEP